MILIATFQNSFHIAVLCAENSVQLAALRLRVGILLLNVAVHKMHLSGS